MGSGSGGWSQARRSQVLYVAFLIGIVGLRGAVLWMRGHGPANPPPVNVIQNAPAHGPAQAWIRPLPPSGAERLNIEAPYLPADVELLNLSRPEAIARLPVMRIWNPASRQDIAGIGNMGLMVDETLCIAIGEQGFTGLLVRGQTGAAQSPGDSTYARKRTVIIRAASPIFASVVGWNRWAHQMTHGEWTYYRHNAVDASMNSWAQIQPDVVVQSSEARIWELLDGARANQVQQDFSFVDGDFHWLRAYYPRDIETQRQILRDGGLEPAGPLAVIFNYYDRGARGIALSMTFNDDIDLRLSILATEPTSAEWLRMDADEVLADLRATVDRQRDTPFDPLLAGLRPVIENVDSRVAGNVSVHSTHVPGELLQDILTSLESLVAATHIADVGVP